MRLFKYDVDLHFKNDGWQTYEVKANCLDNARYNAVKRVIDEISYEYAEQIDLIRVFGHNTDKLLKEY